MFLLNPGPVTPFTPAVHTYYALIPAEQSSVVLRAYNCWQALPMQYCTVP
jgi:hypothetical protein